MVAARANAGQGSWKFFSSSHRFARLEKFFNAAVEEERSEKNARRKKCEIARVHHASPLVIIGRNEVTDYGRGARNQQRPYLLLVLPVRLRHPFMLAQVLEP
jgi:hypothetical protein